MALGRGAELYHVQKFLGHTDRRTTESYAQLDRIDEARAAVAEELRITPDLTLEKVKRQIAAFNPDADFIELHHALRKAGMPE